MFIVFDLDGTLADCTHRLHYVKDTKHKNFDAFYAACDKDTLIQPIAKVFRSLARLHYVEIWSGRSDIVRDKTIRWLAENGLSGYLFLRMRRHGDYTPDDVLKQSWLNTIEPRLYPELAFDDRQRIVDMWRKNNIQCCQVAAWKE
jgi:FMN phosphatase YigB (HAD superfamily)